MRVFIQSSIATVFLIMFGLINSGCSKALGAEEWALNATIIEACSCPMFCQCYFNAEPAAHASGHEGHSTGSQHFCRFNNAFQVNQGSYGSIQLNGAKFWVSGDLGGDFSQGQLDWAVLTFDPSVSNEQREAIAAILAHVYPATWNSFTIADDAQIEWNAGKDQSVARMDGGRTAEVILTRMPGMSEEPVVIHNLKYWGAPRNDGFILMPNQIQAYRAGDKPYEFQGTNGFMITIDMASSDIG